MADHAGGRRSVVNPGTKLWHLCWSNSVLAAVFVLVKPKKKKIISMKPYKKRAPKPLLGRHNWVTSTGGRNNLLPWLTTERRPSAWSAICSQCIICILAIFDEYHWLRIRHVFIYSSPFLRRVEAEYSRKYCWDRGKKYLSLKPCPKRSCRKCLTRSPTSISEKR